MFSIRGDSHYDSDSPSPGADDNASSVAVLLELARKLKPYQKQLEDSKYGVQIAFWGNEENPLNGQEVYDCDSEETVISNNMGSHKFADYLSRKRTDIDQVICLDMVGLGKGLYALIQKKSQTKKRDRSLEDTLPLSIFNKSIEQIRLKLAFTKSSTTIIDDPQKRTLGNLSSDHINFRAEDCIFITNAAYNANYHRNTDLPDTLSYKQMEQLCLVLEKVVLKRSGITP